MYASSSETLTPAHVYAPLSEPYYEPRYSIYPSLQQVINRKRHSSQNQIPTTKTHKKTIKSDAIET